MFQFKFNVEEDTEIKGFDTKEYVSKNEHTSAIGNNKYNSESNEKNVELACEEVIMNEEQRIKNQENLITLRTSIFPIGKENLTYLTAESIKSKLFSIENRNFHAAESNHSDLLPGIYEGGAKIWECTEDLTNYLMHNNVTEQFSQKYVLDLGCGAGLLGILALKFNAKMVHFQDYNKEIIELITIDNVLLNFNNNNILQRCQFYSGDWNNYVQKTANDDCKFDVILTSETIYNPKNYQKILNVLKCKLKRNGLALLAAKKYYFGIGGGIKEFENFLQSDGTFKTTNVWTSSGNVIREIMKIKYYNEK